MATLEDKLNKIVEEKLEKTVQRYPYKTRQALIYAMHQILATLMPGEVLTLYSDGSGHISDPNDEHMFDFAGAFDYWKQWSDLHDESKTGD